MKPTTDEKFMDPGLQKLDTPHGAVRYREVGDGPPLILLHGSGPGVTGWQNFAGNVHAFAQNFRTFILEFPGFGVSDSFGDLHPMVSASMALREFVDRKELPRVSLVGNSMGGFVATAYAIEQPERVARIVTIGGSGVSIFSPTPGEGIVRLSDFIESPTRERLVDWLHSMVYDRSLVTEEMIEERWIQATAEETLAGMKTMYGRAALERMRAGERDLDAVPPWMRLREVGAPTLVTWGRDDRVSPLDMSLLPMRMLPEGELHVFPHCGHWVMIEQKEAFESAAIAFLTRNDESK